jgi:hypothetical protein
LSTDRYADLAQTNFWDRLFALRDEQRAGIKSGVQVVKGSRIPLESNRQGLMRWYMHPEIKDTVLSTFLFFQQEIPPGSRSGRIKFQGNQVMYILEGRGYTLLDGVRHDWKAGDVLNLPIKKDGIVVQHFNADPEKRARFAAAEPNFFACASVDRGCGFEQLENAPEYRSVK